MNLTATITGFLFGLSLILVIGAQNAFVLRQGALRGHVGTIVATCAASDALLIAAGIAGVGAATARWHWLGMLLRGSGGTLLIAYAGASARRAVTGAGPRARAASAQTRRGAMLACLAVTWLNPGAYLDTIVLIGSTAQAHPAARWSFGAGAALGSVVWYVALGYGAALLAPVLRRPGAARCLDGLVATAMALSAVRTLLMV